MDQQTKRFIKKKKKDKLFLIPTHLVGFQYITLAFLTIGDE